ncbi:MAG: prealbumin-like fold domain-containing protein [Promethearchaeota archaeon]|jgi:hypothetical protein
MKIVLISLIIFMILIPGLLGISPNNSHKDNTINNLKENSLKASEFTKDNYSAILKRGKYGYGNITVNDLYFDFLELGFFNYNIYYPLIINEYETNALNMTLEGINFIETTSLAIKDNLDEQIVKKERVSVKINETLKVRYDHPQEGYLIYHSGYPQTKLLEFHVDNGTVLSNLTVGEDFFQDNFDFIVFNYEDFFNAGPVFNFTMYLIWQLELPITDWQIVQRLETPLKMSESEEDFEAKFTYQFRLIAHRYGKNLQETTPVPYLAVAMTINLPDKEELENHALILDGIFVNINTHLNPDKSMEILLSDDFRTNLSFFSLNFTSNYRLKFENPVENTWAIDRLVSGRNLRERIYFPTLLSGPQHLALGGVAIFEPSILFEQVVSNFSLFERDVAFFAANGSIPDQFITRMIIPFLGVGETCPFSIQYRAIQSLRFIVTDNIKMPLVGATLEIFYYGAVYGTYVSNEVAQPITPGNTDENGELIVRNLPHGNYTVRVFHQGRFLKEVQANTNTEIINITTNYPHFPLWISIFGLTNVIILILGLLYYRKNKRSR